MTAPTAPIDEYHAISVELTRHVRDMHRIAAQNVASWTLGEPPPSAHQLTRIDGENDVETVAPLDADGRKWFR